MSGRRIVYRAIYLMLGYAESGRPKSGVEFRRQVVIDSERLQEADSVRGGGVLVLKTVS